MSNSWNGTECINWFRVFVQKVHFKFNVKQGRSYHILYLFPALAQKGLNAVPIQRVTPHHAIQKFFTSLPQNSAMPSRHNYSSLESCFIKKCSLKDAVYLKWKCTQFHGLEARRELLWSSSLAYCTTETSWLSSVSSHLN